MILPTRDFEVDADAPVRRVLWAVYVKVCKSRLAHALDDLAGLLVAGDTYFLPVMCVVWRIKRVYQMQMAVSERSGGEGRLGGGEFEIIQALVEVFVLLLKKSSGWDCGPAACDKNSRRTY
jgi:hypothetical protein